MKKIIASFFILIPEELTNKVLLRLRIDNSYRLYWLSLLGLFFLLLLLSLDYIRYVKGDLVYPSIPFLIFCNHLTFSLFLIPILIINANWRPISIGVYKYQRLLVYATSIFIIIIVLNNAILTLINFKDLSNICIYYIVVNFGIVMLHRDRILVNLVSIFILLPLIIYLYHDQTEELVIKMIQIAASSIICFLASTHIFNSYVRVILSESNLKRKRKQLKKERQKVDQLLFNILPQEIAEELKESGSVKPRHYESATVMMIDFKDFSKKSHDMSAAQLLNSLDYCFKQFDYITAKNNLEKIKTIGDGYLCVGGVPLNNNSHPIDCIHAAREILDFLDNWKKQQTALGKPFFEGRIGIHTGPVVAGVVGDTKMAFDIWGDTVNIAARIEAKGEAGKINISSSTFELIHPHFKCEHRGKIPIKNQKPVDMYFVKEAL